MEQKMNFTYFDELTGLNGCLEKEFIDLKCLLFTRENFKNVFEKTSIPKDACIVYCLTSLRQIPLELHIDRFLISCDQKYSRKFYIGQSSSGVSRISQHCLHGDSAEWWEIGVAFYSKTFNIDTIHSLEKIITEHGEESFSKDTLISSSAHTFLGKQSIPNNIKELIFQVLDWFGIPNLSHTSCTSSVKADKKETNNEDNAKNLEKIEQKGKMSGTMIFKNAQKTAFLELNCLTKSLVLKKGSIIANVMNIKKSFDRSTAQEKYKNMFKIRTDSENRLLEDLPVTSPSNGAEIVTGCSTNGKIYWKNDSNKTIGDVLAKL